MNESRVPSAIGKNIIGKIWMSLVFHQLSVKLCLEKIWINIFSRPSVKLFWKVWINLSVILSYRRKGMNQFFFHLAISKNVPLNSHFETINKSWLILWKVLVNLVFLHVSIKLCLGKVLINPVFPEVSLNFCSGKLSILSFPNKR